MTTYDAAAPPDDVDEQIDTVSKALLKTAQDQSGGDTSLAVAALGNATMYLLASMKVNQKARTDFLAGLDEKFSFFAQTIAEMDTVEQLEQSIKTGETRES